MLNSEPRLEKLVSRSGIGAAESSDQIRPSYLAGWISGWRTGSADTGSGDGALIPDPAGWPKDTPPDAVPVPAPGTDVPLPGMTAAVPDVAVLPGMTGVTGVIVLPGLAGVAGVIVLPGLAGVAGVTVLPGLAGVAGVTVLPGLAGVPDVTVLPGMTGVSGVITGIPGPDITRLSGITAVTGNVSDVDTDDPGTVLTPLFPLAGVAGLVPETVAGGFVVTDGTDTPAPAVTGGDGATA